MVGMLEEAMGMHIDRVDENQTSGHPRDQLPKPNEETIRFLKLLENAEKQLYPGCEEFTKLSFITHLMQLRVESNWTNKSFTSLLQLFKRALPNPSNLPESYDEANKITEDLGFTCKTYDACPNNCIFFMGEDEEKDKCELCETSRYKEGVRR
ncbi:hypothetical protein ACH5RR_018248 [Cinchona calisaya]|uniref:Uncharacterized protein n=1 Tax=Cinchona calisaya TaxID=153742 RepID=A0ABD2ZLU4_9GENT